MNKEKEIRLELCRLRGKICRGDESELWIWVIPNSLACSQRPLRDHYRFGGRNPLPAEARPEVERWVDRVVNAGFLAVISLLEEAQHERYYVRGGLNLHPGGLYGYFESRGLLVVRVPCADYQRPSEDQMKQVLDAFNRLPKPVLLHCSAAIDRTAPIAVYIYKSKERPDKLHRR
jgi:hypothetical protein